MLASRCIWGATIVAAATVLIGTAGALALEQDPALPEVEPGEVVDVAEFSARAQQWSDARRRVREAAIERAEQLASGTKLEIEELAAAAAAPSIAEPSVTATPAAPTTPVEAGPIESSESYGSAQSRESSESESPESSRSEETAESPKAAAPESSEPLEPSKSSESVQSPESSESEPSESAEAEESSESAESPEEAALVEPEADADIGVPEGTTEEQWHALRECESGQNYQVLNPTGQYRGAYQFSVRTWNWVAGMHYPELVGVDPAEASRADQDKMAYQLYEINGWNPWPTCKKRLPS